MMRVIGPSRREYLHSPPLLRLTRRIRPGWVGACGQEDGCAYWKDLPLFFVGGMPQNVHPRFSAAPAMLGYLHQLRQALLSLIERAQKGEVDIAVAIEAHDDVDLRKGDQADTLLQSKLHVKRAQTLTNSSPEIWKTLRAWAHAISEGLIDPAEVQRVLITTAIAEENSIGFLLRDGATSEQKALALSLIESTAKKIKSEKLSAAVSAWRRLSIAQKRLMVSSIVVRDASAGIQEVGKKIANLLWVHKPESQRSQMLDELEGWWFGQAINQIKAASDGNTYDCIRWHQVCLKIDAISSKYGLGRLPDEYSDLDPNIPIDPEHDQRLFVQQLRLIKLQARPVTRAIRDHWRASEQRSKWIRDLLVLPDELTTYNRKLVNEWERTADENCRSVTPSSSADELVHHGQNVFFSVDKLQVLFRDFSGEWLARGSFHMLADSTPGQRPRIGWHPHWSDLISTTKDQEGEN